MKKFIFVILSCFFSSVNSYSQAGKLDSTFGYGVVQTKFGESQMENSSVNKVLLLPDGNMYVLYRNPNLLAKRHADGTLDVTFGRGGFSPVNINIADAALQADGKVIITGSKRYEDDYSTGVALIRYNTDGTLDNAFSENWASSYQPPTIYREEHPTSVIAQKDGKIVLASSSSNFHEITFVLYRFNADGTGDFKVSDREFNAGYSLAINSDEKIVVAAKVTNGEQTDFFIARYNTNGSRDTAFSTNGKKAIDFTPGSHGVALQSNGKIIVGGSVFENSKNSLVLARFNTNGTPDDTFSGDGEVRINFGEGCSGASVAVQNDGRLVVAGQAVTAGNSDFFIARFNPDGLLDNGFSGDGKQTTDFGSVNDGAAVVDIQIDGKIVAGGSGANLARHNTDGTLDNAFSEGGKQALEFASHNDNATSAAVQSDGKVVVVGYGIKNDTAISFLSRYSINGTRDTTFGINGQQQIEFGHAISIQQDGKILVAGSGKGNRLDFALARYNSNGTLDMTFSHDGILTTDFKAGDDEARFLDIQNDGKIVVGGSAESEEGSFVALARYNANGTLDATFSEDGKLITNLGSQYAAAKFIAIQDDGRILGVGTSNIDIDVFNIVRYNTNGTLDANFSEDGIQTTNFDEGIYPNNFTDLDAVAQSVAIQSDGKIVVAGYAVKFPSFAITDPNPEVIVLARYNVDGSLDTTFSGDGRQRFSIARNRESTSSLVIQKDGKIVLAGKSGQDFVFARLNTDGNLDTTFDNDGKQVTDVSGGNDGINDAVIFDNKLYVIGQAGSIGGVVVRYLLDNKSQTPPVVSITTPVNNTTYIAPAAHIKLSAAATDKDGTIGKVEFYNGTTLLDTETVFPYGYVWRNVPAGNYTITAKATDNNGLVTTSAAVHISVVPNKAPTVSIINPANHATYTGPANIHLEAAAKDPDGRITRVEFYNGSTLLHTEYTAPYTFAWRNVSVGDYSILAKATDNWGAVTTSAVVTISVHPNKAPTVSITNPANGESFTSSDTIPLAASAQDPDGRITRVEFYNGSTLLRTEYKLPYTYNWTGVPAGTYTITAVATDNWGAKTISAPVTVTVAAPITIVSGKPNSVSAVAVVKDAANLKVNPNPARNIINIYTEGLQQNKQATLSVISASGITMKTMPLNSKTQTIQMDVSTLVKGTYTIRVISGNKAMYKQFVKL